MSVYGNYNSQSYRPDWMVSNNNYNAKQKQYTQGQYGQADNRTAETNVLLGYLYSADKRGNTDARFSDQEIADAMKVAAQRGDKASAEALGTILFGGIDGRGLPPDMNRDGQVDAREVFHLAGQDGDNSNLSVSDFQKGFPRRAKQGGNSFDPYTNSKTNGNSGYGQGGPQELIMKLLMMLLQAFGGGQYGGGQQYGGGNSYQSYNSPMSSYTPLNY